MFGHGVDLDRATVEALRRSQAVIEFNTAGEVLTANEKFLSLLGYRLEEIVGKHHQMFVDPQDVASPEYRAFWSALAAGTYQAAEFKRIAKDGSATWIQATYNPILDKKGRVAKIIKFASDVTSQKLAALETAAKIDAIGRSQAVIEFNLNGEIMGANDNFCRAFGYGLNEIRGRHHRIFVKADYAASPEYREFWKQLGSGAFQAAEYVRLGKGGNEVGISATYNPIFGIDGKPYKIVKYASVITDRKIAERLLELLRASLERQGSGDLTGTIQTSFSGAYEELRLAYNRTLGSFADVISKVQSSSGALRTATNDILSGANDLAGRTTQQAATIEATSSAMERVAATVSKNAREAASASEEARSASVVAEEGGAVMRRATDAMERITQSADKIGNIIGLIDDIAFQTNLLALNASVEAARAGEMGKGFAVVAVEVRRLAQSAAQASNEVKALIEQSAEQVTTGSRLVNDAAAKLAEMLKLVRQNTDVMVEIARGGNEQAAAIGDVTGSIRKLDEMTRHNAALVEETNAAIEQTDAQASALDGIVARFRLAAGNDVMRLHTGHGHQVVRQVARG